MRLIEKAMEDYNSNSMKSKFVYYRNCLQKNHDGVNFEFDLGIYFRTYDKLFPLEKKLIALSYGNILDIGSSTGYYIPYLMDKGITTGIEISAKINDIAHKDGISNTIIADLFTYKFSNKYDTITLIGNDIALAGTIFRLKKMLKIFYELLNKNGQVLLNIRHIRTLKYWPVVFTPQYDDHFGIPFKLLFLNVNFFLNCALKYGFRGTIIDKDASTGMLFYLVKLVKF
jgi:hypothetical protein